MTKRILVTGGLGYIGSHTVVELLQHNYEVVVIDNLANSTIGTLERIKMITGKAPVFYEADLCDNAALNGIFKSEERFDVVIHFAAFKSVKESMDQPLKYFNNNIISLLNVWECMNVYGCKRIVFSSSATVYGDPAELPVRETTPLKKAASVYGSTKQIGEEILEKAAETSGINVVSLRYFNPVGAHETGLIGELPLGIPGNLLPFITQCAIGKIDQLTVFGNDYDTPDGSCIRDYIHVTDLANAHVKACEKLLKNDLDHSCEVYNIGNGNGYSVLEVIREFEDKCGVKLNYVIGERRVGDVAAIYADVSAANRLLNWKAEKRIEDMVTSAWKWEVALSKGLITCN